MPCVRRGGSVSANAGVGFWTGMYDATKDVRNQALALGANRVLMTNSLP